MPDLTAENELLQDALISQGKMLSAIVNITKGPPEEGSLHSTHDSVESVERLQARVAELEWACQRYIDVGADSFIEDAMDSLDSQPFILRKQAEAVEYITSGNEAALWFDREYIQVSSALRYAEKLRNDADKAGGDSE